jgi:nitroreductase
MDYSQPIVDIIRRRYSCRSYSETPIAAETRQRLAEAAGACTAGPLGMPMRFALIAATEEERSALRGLGTYGTIRNPTGFLAGAVRKGDRNLEQWAYQMERLVLYATDLGLGTVWLGGFFSRSNFSQRIRLERGEELPAVIATGNMVSAEAGPDVFRRMARGDSRLPWERLFFDGRPGAPLAAPAAGAFGEALEMVRIGPSASNKQPWRIVREGSRWHFYLQRTPGYPPRLANRVVGLSDIQRLDLGIAMCHWELTVREAGLGGEWRVQDPGLAPAGGPEYTITWEG